MKGIVLAGGKGTRLYPSTIAVSKQLLTVYDKPMVYYPLSVLLLAGIRDILIISTPMDLPRYEMLFGDGASLGLRISYAQQEEAKGLADAFLIGEPFIGDSSVCLILGDNLFYGQGLHEILSQAAQLKDGALLFGCHVNDPRPFGVISFGEDGRVCAIEEKPEIPKSNYAVPGIYFYDNRVIQYAHELRPSGREELEITDINNRYLRDRRIQVQILGRGTAWFDMGSHRALLAAANYVEAVQSRQGLIIACLEEIAFRKGYITKAELSACAGKLRNTEYGQYLCRIAQEPW